MAKTIPQIIDTEGWSLVARYREEAVVLLLLAEWGKGRIHRDPPSADGKRLEALLDRIQKRQLGLFNDLDTLFKLLHQTPAASKS